MDQSDGMGARISKTDLRDRIQTSYGHLHDVLRTLNEEQLSKPGPNGWAVKDHLVHLGAWVQGIAALLRRQPRFAAMQVEEAAREGLNDDQINEIIYRRTVGFDSAKALAFFDQAHDELIAALGDLSDDDLYRPYSHYLPPGQPADGPDRPVILWILGNSTDHYDEHLAWIQDQLATGYAGT